MREGYVVQGKLLLLFTVYETRALAGLYFKRERRK